MATPETSTFPVAALDWLALPGATSALAVGASSLGIARRLTPHSLHLSVIDRNVEQLASIQRRLPGVTVIAGSPDAIPFVPCRFDQVVISDLLHTLPPRLSLAEFARVLRPGGTLAVVHTGRDDTVPWVRRLSSILRRLDPTAMTDSGFLGTEAAMAHNQYFRDVEQRNFRRWVPVGKPELLAMVEHSSGVASASADDRDALLAEVAELYDTSARAPEPLLLPYTVACWRAVVDHSELTASLITSDVGLRITL